MFKDRVTYHNLYVFGGYSSFLHREVWRYKGGAWGAASVWGRASPDGTCAPTEGMYNHTLGIWEDDFGVCDVEEVGSTCNIWQPVPYIVELPRCSLDNDTCGASESNTTARGAAELARRDHTLVPIFKCAAALGELPAPAALAARDSRRLAGTSCPSTRTGASCSRSAARTSSAP